MSSARDRTLQHLKRLAAAATVVSAGTSSIAACKKEAMKNEDEAGARDKENESDATATTATVDHDATAPSTADAAVFVETTTKDAGNWRQPIPPTGYAVVDPMPPPTRIPPRGDAGKDSCNPPFYFDREGRKHFKKNCL